MASETGIIIPDPSNEAVQSVREVTLSLGSSVPAMMAKLDDVPVVCRALFESLEPLKLYPHDFPQLTNSISTFVDSYGKVINVFRDAVSELSQAGQHIREQGKGETVLVFGRSGELYREKMDGMIGDMDLAGGHDEFQKKLNEQDETAKVITSVFAALATTSVCVGIVAKVAPAAAPAATWMSDLCEASTASFAGTCYALAYMFGGGLQKDEHKKAARAKLRELTDALVACKLHLNRWSKVLPILFKPFQSGGAVTVNKDAGYMGEGLRNLDAIMSLADMVILGVEQVQIKLEAP